MAANPTPLTVWDVYAYCLDTDSEEDIHPKLLGKSGTEAIKAYAAQQNAELVAENERLSNMDILIVAWQVRIGELQTENERLKQQLAWQPIETAPRGYNSPVLFKGYSKAGSFAGPVYISGWVDSEGEVVYWYNYKLRFVGWKPIASIEPQPPKEAP